MPLASSRCLVPGHPPRLHAGDDQLVEVDCVFELLDSRCAKAALVLIAGAQIDIHDVRRRKFDAAGGLSCRRTAQAPTTSASWDRAMLASAPIPAPVVVTSSTTAPALARASRAILTNPLRWQDSECLCRSTRRLWITRGHGRTDAAAFAPTVDGPSSVA